MTNFNFIGSLEVAQNYYSGWVVVVGGGWSEETKLILNSTLVEVSVEVGVGVWQYSIDLFEFW